MGCVRIISGRWRKTPIDVIIRPGLRPSGDRARQVLFNWLEHSQSSSWGQSRILDGFAGTGALGLEAASRGAQQVDFIERDRMAAQQIGHTLARLQAPSSLKVHCTDFFSFLSEQQRIPLYELVFLDPPFEMGLLNKALHRVHSYMVPEGLVYLESERPWTSLVDAQEAERWAIHKEAKTGQVWQVLLRPRL